MAVLRLENKTVYFSGNLRIDTISETVDVMQDLVFDPPITLDFSQVQQLDTSAISVILEIQRQLHLQHPQASPVKLVGVPDSLRSLMQLYGVDTFLLN